MAGLDAKVTSYRPKCTHLFRDPYDIERLQQLRAIAAEMGEWGR